VMLVSHLSAHRAQRLKPLNSRLNAIKHFFLNVTLHFYAMRLRVNLY